MEITMRLKQIMKKRFMFYVGSKRIIYIDKSSKRERNETRIIDTCMWYSEKNDQRNKNQKNDTNRMYGFSSLWLNP